jgi:hypothetical protein
MSPKQGVKQQITSTNLKTMKTSYYMLPANFKFVSTLSLKANGLLQ